MTEERIRTMSKELEAAEQRAERLAGLLRRYRNETPLGHQPHMIAHEVDAELARINAELKP